MGLHKPFDRSFVVVGGNVLKEGWSLDLVKGQFGIFDTKEVLAKGMKAVKSFKGKPKDRKYELKVGNTNKPLSRSTNNKSQSSYPFTVGDVIKVGVSAPDSENGSIDDVVLGYNGIDDSTAFKFKPGTRYKVVIRVSGEKIGYLGYPNSSVEFPLYIEAPECKANDNCTECDECAEVDALPLVTEAIELFKKTAKLRGGVSIEEVVDISVVKKCDTEPSVTEIPYKFHTLETCDTGDSNAEALVKAQYPQYDVARIDRKGVYSVYQLLAPSGDTIAPYSKTLPSLIKGCESCPANYTEVPGGLLYAISLEDDGMDKTADIQALPNAVADSAKKGDTQSDGVGYYTVVLTQELSEADLETFLTVNPTATVENVGSIEAICNSDSAPITENWVAGDTCNVIEQEYKITLPDNECGQNRLAELQAAYPDLTIELEGTAGGCQTVYKAKVKTNLVCDACSPIFKDMYKSEAPASYDNIQWEAIEGTPSTGCKVGIRVKGKVFEVTPDDSIVDSVSYISDSTKVDIAGGFLSEVRVDDYQVWDELKVTYLSKYAPATHKGGNLSQFEDEGFTFFNGRPRHNDYFTRVLLGEESNLDYSKQYVDYSIMVKRPIFSQGLANRTTDYITYHIFVEVGKHQDVEELINKLANAAGKSAVKAFA